MKQLTATALLLIMAASISVYAGESKVNRLIGNPNVSFYVETDQGVPEYVSGKLGQSVSREDRVATALNFFEENKQTFKMTDPHNEFGVNRIEEDRMGNHHLRFDQYYKGLKVFGGNLVSHFNTNGDLITVNGYYQAGIDVDATPVVYSFEAMEIAAADLEGFFGPANPQQPELLIFPWLGTYYLCWHLLLRSDDPIGRWGYFVDAVTGNIIYKEDRIRRSDEVGTGLTLLNRPRNHIDVWYTGDVYQMRDNTRQLNNNIHGHNGQMPDGNYIQTSIAGSELPGPISEDDDNIWNGNAIQRAAVDAHVYTGVFYDWLLREFGRNSYDKNGASMISSVYYTVGENNAWWIGDQIVFHNWTSPYTRSFSACPEIVGHEWAHGITEYNSDLTYRWETGALNESFSDIMGVAFEFAHDTLDPPDWLVAENFLIYATAMSSMSHPEQYYQPHTYEGVYWFNQENCHPTSTNDYCGVHTNQTVGNKWFYLLSDGDTHNGVTVNGIGVENAVQIVYHANTYYWTQTSDYFNGALGTYYAALDLDPSGVWADEVITAWLAVGIEIPEIGLTFDYPIGNPMTIPTYQAVTVEVEVGGLVGGLPEPGTGRLHYSIDGGEYETVSMTAIGENHYQVNLPALVCTQTLEYYFSAQESGGEWFFDPDPAEPYSPSVVFDIPVCFEDDFETDKGWTVYGSASAGHWERGIPVGDGTDGIPGEDYDGSGHCFLTENVLGDSDVDDGYTNLVSPAFDMDGSDGLVKFAAWFTVRCASLGGGEEMNIYISNDDGDNWVLAEFLGPIIYAHGGWYEHQFEISDFVTPTSQMKLRFEVYDIDHATCVEAGVDAVEVIRYVCDFICGDIDGQQGINILDIVYLINFIYKSGPDPLPPESADFDGQPGVNILDIVYLINFIYKNGPEPNCFSG